MPNSAELKQVYQEAIALTEQQADAIASEDWDLLNALLMKRERAIARAEALLAENPNPAEKAEIRRLLLDLQAKDTRIQARVKAIWGALKSEMGALNRSSDAMVGYLRAAQDVPQSHFIDHDQ